MRLWHVECVVTDSRHYDLMKFLESIKAYNVASKTFSNGSADQVSVQDKSARAPKGSQTDWLAAHIKEEIAPSSLKAGFEKAGFKPGGLYAALTRAVKQKLIKKTAAGTYKPIGG